MTPGSWPKDTGCWLPGPRLQRPALGGFALSGLGFGVKDLIDVGGSVTGCGNPDWAAAHAPAVADAPCVRALRDAGGRVEGKTVTDEFAFSLEGENAHFGTPRNPQAPGRLPGGSSSGSAVAVAAGLVDFALGTDTGGSVRVPASFCGIYGFRPTHGAVSLAGVMPFAPSLDTVGWFARSASVMQRVGGVLLRRAEPVLPLRLLLADDVFDASEGMVAARLREVADRLGTRERVHAFDGPAESWLNCYATLQGDEIRRSIGPWLTQHRPRMGHAIAARFEGLAAIVDDEVAAWMAWRCAQTARLIAMLAGGRVLVFPTTPCPALPITAGEAERGRFYATALSVNALAGLAGLPQLSLPIATTADGLPLGLSVVGAPGTDMTLLSLATTLASRGDLALLNP